MVFRVFHASKGFKVPVQMSMWTDFIGKTSPRGIVLRGVFWGKVAWVATGPWYVAKGSH